MRHASRSAIRRRFAEAVVGLRRRAAHTVHSPRAVVLIVAALVATAFAVTPASADDPGLQCAVTATASITVTPSPVVYGQNATLQWSADCVGGSSEAVLLISGPGTSSAPVPVGGGSETVFISQPGTLTWGVTVVDQSSDTSYSRGLATVSASVTGVTTVPDLTGDSQPQATADLQAAGGYVLNVVGSLVDCDHIGTVSDQTPKAGTVLLPHSPVSVWFGKKPASGRCDL
ncbi:PASTA domain-containing protein [Streptomyces sp. NPDC048278]|uniref:PASTA domain-containing protein n=1 Tax=Streptomyces sp. NPDC048278 TaxID=3155809 RepID=UPI00341F1662